MNYDPDEDEDVGKGRPPLASRFRPGQSGNPRGRPRGKRVAHPYEAVLGQMVTIRENGEERRVRADVAFMLHIATKGLASGGVNARAVLRTIDAQAGAASNHTPPRNVVNVVYADPGDTKYAARWLRISKLLDGARESARLVLETWVIDAALARLGERQLSVAEQQVVMSKARFPTKVRWPGWWSVMPG